jgi:hypothetical protein
MGHCPQKGLKVRGGTHMPYALYRYEFIPEFSIPRFLGCAKDFSIFFGNI